MDESGPPERKSAAFCDGYEGCEDEGEVPRRTCPMDRQWCHSLKWGTLANHLTLWVKSDIWNLKPS